jgi:hypothetical protein
MNLLFLSPNFPDNFRYFCAALREYNVSVLGIGDCPHHQLHDELKAALSDYVFLPNLQDYEAVYRSAAFLVSNHGRLAAIESHNEFWLETEARLREDFNVQGPRPADLVQTRSKRRMAELYAKAGVPYPRTLVATRNNALHLAHDYGYPLVVKPDYGMGADDTHCLHSPEDIDRFLVQDRQGHVVQPFIRGTITTFDGLTDARGKIIFCTSYIYNAGVMEVKNEQRDVYYYSRRRIPNELRRLGTDLVKEFGLKQRFFHSEFFEQEDGRYCGLEMNMRPPGGFTTDLMNYASDTDVYRLWAKVITSPCVDDFQFDYRYHSAHASRRSSRTYSISTEEIEKRYAQRIVSHRHLPRTLAGSMGDDVYILRDPDEVSLLETIRQIHQ